MKKAIISISAILILLIAAAVVYYFMFYDKEKLLDDTQYQVPITGEVTMPNVYTYLSEQSEDLKMSYTYLDDTEAIQVTFQDIESDDLRNMFIVLDSENNQIHIKNVNDNLYSDGYSSYGVIPLTVYNMEMETLGPEILDTLVQYYKEIPEDEGDAKHYGESVNVITNPDGSISIDLQSQTVVE